MDVMKMVGQLELIIKQIDQVAITLEKNTNRGLKEMPALIEQIQGILPDWFYFVKQTEIGSEEIILGILKDIIEAMQVTDGVLLMDALIFGLQELMVEYCNIIKEAM